ncbi:hypothetical protein EAH87_17285 [Sphingomonas koreensis]|nr:hypothetical protein EAH87_17285 [Sphingomonas koreensis]
MQEPMVSERAAIQERLRKKEAEVAGLEEKLKAAKVYLAALRDVIRLFNEHEEENGDTKLRQGSAVAQARDIILAKGEPVHIDELLAAMGKDVTRDSKASLAGSIAAYVRRSEIFTRPAPNTFGLAELGHVERSDEDLDEPPSGFGTQPVRFSGGFADDLDEDVPF